MRPVVLTVSPSLMRLVLAQHHGADRVLLQVQRQADDVARELEHFAVARVGQAVDAHDAVGDRHDRADVAGFGAAGEVLDPLTDEVADFRCLDRHDLMSFTKILKQSARTPCARVAI